MNALSSESKPDTRERLIDAAGEVFAEFGFQGGVVRDICRRAEANIAAVNYHFRDKEGLYHAVLQHAIDCTAELAVAQPVPAEQKLAWFVHTQLTRMLDTSKPIWQERLVVREMANPTPALDRLVHESIFPKFLALRQIVSELLGVALEHRAVRWYAASVIAQCLFYFHNKQVITRLYPDLIYAPEQIAELAAHITRFSLDALRGGRAALQQAEPTTAAASREAAP